MGINLRTDDLIYPYFIKEGARVKEPIELFPGQYRLSLPALLEDIGEVRELGINKVLLFGLPASKDEYGLSGYKEDNIVSLAIREIKKKFPDLTVMTDVCLCAYTSHGHCGITRTQGHKDTPACREQKPGQAKSQVEMDNDETLKILAKIAIAHAGAGADYVAPSAMAKQQVAAIRKALDVNGYKDTRIMGYSAKFASNFYGPFRNAADSSPKFGDRSAYQLAYDDRESAILKIEEDIKEGADIVMVKPALSYLDIVREAKTRLSHPLAAYNVSGEYAFVKYGARLGLWDERKMVTEILTSIKRAGADHIITYHAKDVAKWLKE